MRVGIDTQSVVEKKTGLGIYTKNLLQALKKIAPENEYIEFHSKNRQDLSTPKRFLWDQVGLLRAAKKAKLGLLHKPCFSAPIFYKGKLVLTVHDIIPVFLPHNLSFSSRFYYARWMPYTFGHADKIIAVSESTKKDLIKYFKLPSEKIMVIYEGSSFENSSIQVNEEIKQQIRKKYHLPKKFILTVSTLEPKKNLSFLVKCFYEVKKKFQFPEKLVIVGKIGWGTGPFFEQIKKYHLEKEIILPGYVDDEDLPAIFKMATVFVFPSLYEGFGLPVLDGLKLNCPVIASNSSSLPEIVGNAGILADPKNEKEWIEAIGAMLTNNSLRKKYMKLGLKRAKKFSWDKCAKRTLEVYNETLNH